MSLSIPLNETYFFMPVDGMLRFHAIYSIIYTDFISLFSVFSCFFVLHNEQCVKHNKVVPKITL